MVKKPLAARVVGAPNTVAPEYPFTVNAVIALVHMNVTL
jgi:hypothetical protein